MKKQNYFLEHEKGEYMTLKELSQLYYLNKEIEHDKQRLSELQSKAYVSSSPNLSGESGGGIGDRVGRYAAELSDIEAIIRAKQIQCIHERNRLERYIADIPDSLTRQIFTLRFIDGLSWVRVAHGVGGGNTEAGVKMICYRYINGAA